jgi:hypothetical protein
MAKRFTDTNKWKKSFIKNLSPDYKLFWLYLLDECDHAGIWHVEIEVAEARLGIKINESEALCFLNENVIKFDGGEKWFIPHFIEFQYGELNPENRAHKSVIDQLIKYKLIKENKGLTSPLQGAMDKDKDKDMDKDKEKKNKTLFKNSGITIEKISEAFLKTEDLKKADAEYYYNALLDWSDSGGKLGIDWIASARKWARRDLHDGKLKIIKPSAPIRKSSNFDRIMETDYSRYSAPKDIKEILKR